MKDETKEILEQSLDYEFDLTFKQRKELLDYITNLQEEINKLTAESTEWESKYYDLQEELEEQKRIEQASLDTINNLQEENEDLKDYLDIFKLSNKTKQETIDDFRKRVDKAIEYIKEEFADIDFMKKEYKDIHRIYYTSVETDVRSIIKLNNILNGDDSDE